MEVIVKTSYGDIKVKDVMVDIDGTNLMDGVDIFYEGNVYCTSITGVDSEHLSENPEYLEKILESEYFQK